MCLDLGQLISSPCLEKIFVLQADARHLKGNLLGLSLLASIAEGENCPFHVLTTYTGLGLFIWIAFFFVIIQWDGLSHHSILIFLPQEGFISLRLP